MFHGLGIHQGSWAKIGGLVVLSMLISWMIFLLFPTNPDASSVVTVFAGIFGILWLIFKEPGK